MTNEESEERREWWRMGRDDTEIQWSSSSFIISCQGSSPCNPVPTSLHFVTRCEWNEGSVTGKWWTKKDWARLLLAFRTHHLPVTLTSVSPSVPPSVPLRERVTDERREKGTRRESKEKVKKVMRDHVIPILTAFRILFTSVASGWDYIVPERSLLLIDIFTDRQVNSNKMK